MRDLQIFLREQNKNKINFIGPSADSMDLCGDKMKCKAAMLKAKVPTVPGSPGLLKDADDAEKIAEDATASVKGKVFHRKDIGTKELIEKRVKHIKSITG